jgi:hypothetical protein
MSIPFNFGIFSNEANLRTAPFTFHEGGILTVRCAAFFQSGNPTVPLPQIDRYTIKPINFGFGFWNPDGDPREFSVGSSPTTRTWSDLSDGRYFLQISVADHHPHKFTGSGTIDV